MLSLQVLHTEQQLQQFESLDLYTFNHVDIFNYDYTIVKQSLNFNIIYLLGSGFLDTVSLGTARQGSAGTEPAVIEQCECTEGYVGQFCESCISGYHRDPPNSGPMNRCVPCNCNMHSDYCDTESGKFISSFNKKNVFPENFIVRFSRKSKRNVFYLLN